LFAAHQVVNSRQSEVYPRSVFAGRGRGDVFGFGG